MKVFIEVIRSNFKELKAKENHFVNDKKIFITKIIGMQ